MTAPRTYKNLWGFLKRAKNEDQPKRKGKRIFHRIKQTRQYNSEMEMDDLGNAVDAALDIENPDFTDLYSLYGQAEKDRHLKSQVETAINDIQQSPFIVEVDGKEDEELKDLFDAAWYDDFIEATAAAEFWSHSLVEFPEVNEENIFDSCFLLPRENVDPARQRIIIDKEDEVFLPYGEKMESLNLIEIRGKERLGLFEITTAEVILKKYARTDWSQASEKYGMPFLDIETETTDKKELDAIEDSAAEFASNGYFIHGSDTKATIQQAAKGDFYKIYMESIELANKELSKAVNGQSATADNQAYVGASEVQERIKNTFTKARLRRVQNHVNGKLIPLMIANAYLHADKLAKAKVKYTDLMNLAPVLNTDPKEEPGDPDKEKGGGKANTNAGYKKKVIAAETILDKWLKRFYDKLSKNKSITIDPEIWRLNFASLNKAMLSAGIKFTGTYKYAALATELQGNAVSFSAFKNHDEQQELLDLMVDDKDRPRSWNEFKKVAQPITKKYNETWLKSEHAQAETSAMLAIQWEGFKENADLYPNVRFDAVVDGDTTSICKKLDGKIFALTDPRLKKIAPQNHWGCRSGLTQTDEAISKDVPELKPNKGFDFNPGTDQKLFSEENGYQTEVNKKDSVAIEKQAKKLRGDE